MSSELDETMLARAVEAAGMGVKAGQSPFGAVIARGETVVAEAHNGVRARTDPTAHAEILAIRRAALALGTIDLSGCTVYSTCEPCPMCAAAIHWARCERVVYGATIDDAAGAGFNELRLPAADLFRLGGSGVRCEHLPCAECVDLFQRWLARPDARAY